MAAFDTRATEDEGGANKSETERARALQMGIAHTIRIRDRHGRRLSLLLTRENCANKCVFRTYVRHKRPAPASRSCHMRTHSWDHHSLYYRDFPGRGYRISIKGSEHLDSPGGCSKTNVKTINFTRGASPSHRVDLARYTNVSPRGEQDGLCIMARKKNPRYSRRRILIPPERTVQSH